MLRTGARGRWMSALSPTAGLPASSFVSSLLEVLALMSQHMNQWDLRPEGSLGRKNQRSSTVQPAFIEPPGPVCWSCWRGEGWLK